MHVHIWYFVMKHKKCFKLCACACIQACSTWCLASYHKDNKTIAFSDMCDKWFDNCYVIDTSSRNRVDLKKKNLRVTCSQGADIFPLPSHRGAGVWKLASVEGSNTSGIQDYWLRQLPQLFVNNHSCFNYNVRGIADNNVIN